MAGQDEKNRLVERDTGMRGLLRRFKQSLRDGECVIGPFMKTCDPAFVEVAGTQV